jgi:hypothetical protein
MPIHARVYHKNSSFCCPLVILWCNHYYHQTMMIDWLKDIERDNLTPRHLHAYIDDELQNVPDRMCCNFGEWLNWTTTVVDRFLWIMGPFFLSLSLSLLGIGRWLNERRRKTILLSFSHSHLYTHVPIDGQQYRCVFAIVKTKLKTKIIDSN